MEVHLETRPSAAALHVECGTARINSTDDIISKILLTSVSSGEGVANMGGREVTLAGWPTDHAVTILEDDGTLMGYSRSIIEQCSAMGLAKRSTNR